MDRTLPNIELFNREGGESGMGVDGIELDHCLI